MAINKVVVLRCETNQVILLHNTRRLSNLNSILRVLKILNSIKNTALKKVFRLITRLLNKKWFICDHQINLLKSRKTNLTEEKLKKTCTALSFKSRWTQQNKKEISKNSDNRLKNGTRNRKSSQILKP